MVKETKIVLDALSKSGLLLKQDKVVPNVVTLVTGETLRSSWWSHPKGRLIFAVLAELAEHPDVLFVKLLSEKDTLVHRRLWPALLAVVTAGEAWQRRGLSAAGRKLLASVNGAGRSAGGRACRGADRQPAVSLLPQKKDGQARSAPDAGGDVRASGPVVKEIEVRLLAHAEQVHTESGRHEIVLERWSAWQRRVRVRPLGTPNGRPGSPLRPGPSPAQRKESKVGARTGGESRVTPAALGRQQIEEAIAALGAPLSALPWRAVRRARA